METRASYVLIGAFTLGVLLLTMLFVLWLGKWQLDREWDEYDVVFREAVTGLSVGGAVQFNGIQVGAVRQLILAPEDARRVIARIRVAGGTPVTVDTTARLTFQGLTGVAIIQLAGGKPGSAKLVAGVDEVRPRIIADDSALQKLLASGEDVVANVNTVIVSLSRFLNEENVRRLSTSIENIERISSAVGDRSDDIGQAIGDLAEASAQLKRTLEGTEALVAKLDAAADSTRALMDGEARDALAAARESLGEVKRLAANANAVIEENRGSIDSATGRGLAQVGPTLVELRATLRELERVATRIEEDPSALLNGTERPKEYRDR
jgi:phospholipid/cholesterol/gamma-HCH transport system substrate-binding protein